MVDEQQHSSQTSFPTKIMKCLSILFLGCLLASSAHARGYGARSQIVGGEIAEPNSIPYQVSIQRIATDFHFCGGAVLEANVILTAAHCCEFETASELRIVAGDHDLFEEEGPEQSINVKEIIMHESFRYTH